MLKGLVIKESLEDLSFIDCVEIIKTEQIDASDAVEFQPDTWTLAWFQCDEDRVSEVVEKLSKSIRYAWYCDFDTKNYKFVVFKDKVFKYSHGDKRAREEAQQFGRLVGITEEQLDWGDKSFNE